MTSQDILFVTLALCAAVITFFFAWFSLSLIRILRGVTTVIEDVRSRIERIGESIEQLTEKVAHTALSFSTLAGGVKEVLDFLGRRRSAKRTRRAADVTNEDG
jgi:methyl-accepting chemotaxis protein